MTPEGWPRMASILMGGMVAVPLMLMVANFFGVHERD
jgi:hypothetical protein